MMPARTLAIAALLVLAALTAAAAPRAVDDLMMDMQIAPLDREPAPVLSVTTLDGTRVSLADALGNVVLVYFWATW